MTRGHRYLVNYFFNNLPKTTEIVTELEALKPYQTRAYLEALHAVKTSDAITGINIRPIPHRAVPPETATLCHNRPDYLQPDSLAG